ncbi:class I SAM-dependent methyltransferase [Tateyamaria sp. SN3-11]|uniref:class I SAM-dependent methyltransferase n=1 Tax=Tateyamaria sp. SN3-11 TaxID=3092147 RepID=UPI0039ED7274
MPRSAGAHAADGLAMSAIDEYIADAAILAEPYSALSEAEILRSVSHLLPSAPAILLDIGAGIGRSGAWFAAQGITVTSVEPVAAFRAFGQERFGVAMQTWIDDRLPHLARVRDLGVRYDTILISGVWHHLSPRERIAALHQLPDLLADNGRIILSLRHGPCPRTHHPAPVSALAGSAQATGLDIEFQTNALSIQQSNRDSGVTWTWVCLRHR